MSVSAGWVGWAQPHLLSPNYSEHSVALARQSSVGEACTALQNLEPLHQETYSAVGIYFLPVFWI